MEVPESPRRFLTGAHDTKCHRGKKKKNQPWEAYLRIYHEVGYSGTRVTQEGLGTQTRAGMNTATINVNDEVSDLDRTHNRTHSLQRVQEGE